MADDNDDNILIDSDEEEQHHKKKSKPSDFIPKPRLIHTQVAKLVTAATTPTDSPKVIVDETLLEGSTTPRRHSYLAGGPARAGEDVCTTGSSNSLPKAFTLQSAPDSLPTGTHQEASYNRLLVAFVFLHACVYGC